MLCSKLCNELKNSIKCQLDKKKDKNRRRSVPYLYGANNDVIDRDEDQLHEETDETHHDEADGNAESNLGEF